MIIDGSGNAPGARYCGMTSGMNADGHETRPTGWAVTGDATWSYRPALAGLIVGIILFPALFLFAYLPSRNDSKVTYPALRDQLTVPNGATAGQVVTPQAK